MKLEQQVCSLELAKKLKDLGVKQESAFYWVDGEICIHRDYSEPSISDDLWKTTSNGCGCCGDGDRAKERFSAFTCSELGEMLPEMSPFDMDMSQIYSFRRERVWHCQFYSRPKGNHIEEIAETEADARAKMLVYLIEQGIVKP